MIEAYQDTQATFMVIAPVYGIRPHAVVEVKATINGCIRLDIGHKLEGSDSLWDEIRLMFSDIEGLMKVQDAITAFKEALESAEPAEAPVLTEAVAT